MGFVSAQRRLWKDGEQEGAGRPCRSQSPLLRGPTGGTGVWGGVPVSARETDGRRRNSETGRPGSNLPRALRAGPSQELHACAGPAGPAAPAPGASESPSAPEGLRLSPAVGGCEKTGQQGSRLSGVCTVPAPPTWGPGASGVLVSPGYRPARLLTWGYCLSGNSGRGAPSLLLPSARNGPMGLDQGPLSRWASFCASVNGACSAQVVWALGAALLGPESGPPHLLVSILCLAGPVPPVAAVVRVLGIGTHLGGGGQAWAADSTGRCCVSWSALRCAAFKRTPPKRAAQSCPAGRFLPSSQAAPLDT